MSGNQGSRMAVGIAVLAGVGVIVTGRVTGIHILPPFMYAVTHLGSGVPCSDTSIPGSGENVVVYNDSGFYPGKIRVVKGETVTWVSQGPAMWVASNFHPSHAQYGLTSKGNPVFDQREAGCSYRFRFNRTGNWDYHNHLAAREHGTVIVDGQASQRE